MRKLKTKKRLLYTLTTMLLLLSNISRTLADSTSNSTPTIKCSQVISACQNALDAKDGAIKARDEEIGTQGMLLKSQADALVEKDRELHSVFRSPYLYLVLGAAAGVYLGKK